MKNYIKHLLFTTIGLFIFLGFTSKIQAQQSYCISGCNDNTFVWSSDPNTIEYDNMVSGFHSTILKESDGTVKVWGQGASATNTNLTTPRAVTPANGYNYQGEILKVTLASNAATTGAVQFAILTTEGLYVWGATNHLVNTTVKSNSTFGKVSTSSTGTNSYGLPTSVNPTDVKMLFGSYRTLGIVTCSGEAWMLSDIGGKNGRGSNSNSVATWTQVQTSSGVNLTNVVAMRGTFNAMMALTSNGEIYTWGTGTYLGDNTGASNRSYATKITLPNGITPKMIGMTYNRTTSNNTQGNSYYLLSTNGELYALGNNGLKQLGDFSTTARNSWIRVKSTNSTTNMSNIAWFSPNEHDYAGHAAVSALTRDGKLWSWGSNNGEMIGGGTVSGNTNATKDPIFMGRNLGATDKLIALETGGHTTMIIRQCSKKYGYIGHKINGSMGDGSNSSGNISNFDFTNTAEVNLCGAPTTPVVKDLEICAGETGNLDLAHIIDLPQGMKIEWYTSNVKNSNNLVENPHAVGQGEYYAFYIPTDNSACSNPEASEKVIVRLKADLKIEITVDNDNPTVGDQVEFTLKVTNTGGSDAENVFVNSMLSDGYEFVSGDTGYIGITGVWTVGALNIGTNKTLKIKAIVKAEGSYSFPVSVESEKTECDTTNNDAEISVIIKSTLLITNPMVRQRIQ